MIVDRFVNVAEVTVHHQPATPLASGVSLVPTPRQVALVIVCAESRARSVFACDGIDIDVADVGVGVGAAPECGVSARQEAGETTSGA